MVIEINDGITKTFKLHLQCYSNENNNNLLLINLLLMRIDQILNSKKFKGIQKKDFKTRSDV